MSKKRIMADNVILTGFMGTGKSTVGRLLAKKLSYQFVDLDELIVAREDLSIRDIFDSKGEPYFRNVESVVLRDVLQQHHMVIATGGGAVLSEENRKFMEQSGLVVNLLASPEEIAQRLVMDTERPLLLSGNKMDSIISLLQERECCYALADFRIDTTGKSVEEIVVLIIAHIEQGVKCETF